MACEGIRDEGMGKMRFRVPTFRSNLAMTWKLFWRRVHEIELIKKDDYR